MKTVNQEAIRKSMQKELNVLLNKMFEAWPEVTEFRLTVDHLEHRDDGTHITASADSLVDEGGAVMDRNYLCYRTRDNKCLEDDEDFIGDEYTKQPSRYNDHKRKGLCVRCNEPATHGTYCLKCKTYMNDRYKKVSKK